ncbi:hypothetical protein AAZX31_13G027600 [Glycine max]
MKANLAKIEKQSEFDKLNYPRNYATLYDFFARSLSVAALIVVSKGKHGTNQDNAEILKKLCQPSSHRVPITAPKNF